jgi:hypothetical protein
VRNSLLVKWSCAENITGLSIAPKPWMSTVKVGMVGERSVSGEGIPEGVLEQTEVRMQA